MGFYCFAHLSLEIASPFAIAIAQSDAERISSDVGVCWTREASSRSHTNLAGPFLDAEDGLREELPRAVAASSCVSAGYGVHEQQW